MSGAPVSSPTSSPNSQSSSSTNKSTSPSLSPSFNLALIKAFWKKLTSLYLFHLLMRASAMMFALVAILTKFADGYFKAGSRITGGEDASDENVPLLAFLAIVSTATFLAVGAHETYESLQDLYYNFHHSKFWQEIKQEYMYLLKLRHDAEHHYGLQGSDVVKFIVWHIKKEQDAEFTLGSLFPEQSEHSSIDVQGEVEAKIETIKDVRKEFFKETFEQLYKQYVKQQEANGVKVEESAEGKDKYVAESKKKIDQWASQKISESITPSIHTIEDVYFNRNGQDSEETNSAQCGRHRRVKTFHQRTLRRIAEDMDISASTEPRLKEIRIVRDYKRQLRQAIATLLSTYQNQKIGIDTLIADLQLDNYKREVREKYNLSEYGSIDGYVDAADEEYLSVLREYQKLCEEFNCQDKLKHMWADFVVRENAKAREFDSRWQRGIHRLSLFLGWLNALAFAAFTYYSTSKVLVSLVQVLGHTVFTAVLGGVAGLIVLFPLRKALLDGEYSKAFFLSCLVAVLILQPLFLGVPLMPVIGAVFSLLVSKFFAQPKCTEGMRKFAEFFSGLSYKDCKTKAKSLLYGAGKCLPILIMSGISWPLFYSAISNIGFLVAASASLPLLPYIVAGVLATAMALFSAPFLYEQLLKLVNKKWPELKDRFEKAGDDFGKKAKVIGIIILTLGLAAIAAYLSANGDFMGASELLASLSASATLCAIGSYAVAALSFLSAIVIKTPELVGKLSELMEKWFASSDKQNKQVSGAEDSNGKQRRGSAFFQSDGDGYSSDTGSDTASVTSSSVGGGDSSPRSDFWASAPSLVSEGSSSSQPGSPTGSAVDWSLLPARR
jgi:hypothetical protein